MSRHLAKEIGFAQLVVVNDEMLRRFATRWIKAWNSHDLEGILSHYAEDVEFASPLVSQLMGSATGSVRGKPALRGFFACVLNTFPKLGFELLHPLAGVDGCTLMYRGVNDLTVAETMTFNAAGLVRAAGVAYSSPAGATTVKEWTRDGYVLTDDASRMNLDAVCAMLQGTYWADDRSREVIEKSLRHSTCLHLLHEGRQVGLIRGITDHATFTWVCDVIVDEAHRGRGLGKWMVACFLEHPALQTISHHLCTKDAHALYESFGFQRIEAMRRSKRPMPFLLKSPA